MACDYSIRMRQATAHLLAVVMITVLSVITMPLIRDVDTPYSGPVRIDPADMTFTERDITEDFTAKFGADRLPCDDRRPG